MSETILPVFSSRSFMVSGLTFWSLVRFELQPAGAAHHHRVQAPQVVASLVVEQGLQARGRRSCGTRAQELWDVGSGAVARGLSNGDTQA